jgi:hypothetical protein
MDTRTVLAAGKLSESDACRFASELAQIKVGEFVSVKEMECINGLVTVHVLDNGLLPDEVAYRLFQCSLLNEGGELHRLGWGKVMQIVD